MSLILTSKIPWRRRPSGLVEIDRSSPQALGISGLWYAAPGIVRDAINGKTPSIVGTSEFRSSEELGAYLSTGTDAYVNTGLVGPSGTSGLAVSAWVLFPNITSDSAIIGARGTGWRFSMQGASAGDPLRLTFFGAWDQDSSASGIVANTWTHVAVTYDIANIRFYVNGKLLSTHARTTAISATGTNAFYLSAGNNNGPPEMNAGCRFVDTRYYQQWRSSADVWTDYDPQTRWSLYAPLVRRTYFDIGIGGGGGTTYPFTGSGGLTLSGIADLASIKGFLATGGLTLAGDPPIALARGFITSGGLALSGAGITAYIPPGGTVYPFTGSGGLTLTGDPTIALVRGFLTSGGLTFSGAPTIALVRGVLGTGGLTFSGASVLAFLRSFTASGGLILSGAGIGSYISASLASRLSLTQLLSLQVRLDVKQLTDSGEIAAVSTDVGGTVVTLNKAFKDIDSIVATVKQTVRREVVVDFVDTPNPTTFKVLVFDSAGARVSDTVYWVARGVG